METQEQTFGKESVERSLGYVPADVPMPQSEPQGDEITRTELEDVASEFAKGRDQRTREVESRPVDSAVEVQDTSGHKLPDNETLSIEEASHLVTGARNKQETTADLDDRDALAREIDALRNGVTTEQLFAEQPQTLVEQQQQPQPQPSPDEIVARKLQESPELMAAMQQAIANEQAKSEHAFNQYTAAAVQSAVTAGAALLASYPELAGLAPQQIPTAIDVVSKQNPARAAAMIDHLKQTQRIIHDAAQVQQQHQQWHAQRHQAAFQQDAARHDHAYDHWARSQGVSPDEQKAIKEEVVADFRRQGWSDQQIAHAYNNDGAMRSLSGQIQMHQAAAYRLQQRKMANVRTNKLDRTPPHVVRPGSPLERANDQDYRIRSLNKGGGPLSAKEAAALVVAQRSARR